MKCCVKFFEVCHSLYYRLARRYNKKTKRWTVSQVKIPKKYPFVEDLMADVIHRKLSKKVPARQSVPFAPSDPRSVKRHLAPESPPPSKKLFEDLQSRFN